ncbi:TetR/AcrR family transcriptional regulator [Lysinibacillus sp. NPDC097279]|uniref:TetR/AcrR family transcriptional regulator n=1 Tax=unclassified Lysinibacillus TaxID=2636778 RepID=UPI001171FAC2|nr:TetR/AcrR family transcriptional regulator [Lysinibacillus sp. CD3-6]QPQ36202.1 TetR/AcrR family transcriptional regulator [Lysinibacillus sp. JNUCC-52]UED82139.1 TetR/AcrR family transcriptional regulator [Lysinibacillus sp. CD3-6]
MDLENKTTKGIQTQLHIMSVALELFKKLGYDNVSVDRIVKESKTSKGSFYQHFPSKSSIFMMRFMEMDKSYVHIYEEIKQQYTLAIERLEAFCLAVFRCIEEEMGKDLMRVIYSAAIISNEHTFFTNENRKLYVILHQIIEEGKKDNSIRHIESTEKFFQMIVQSLMGAIYYWGLQLDHAKLEDLGKPLIKHLITSLRN